MHLKKFLSGDAQFKYPIMSFYKIGMNEFQQNSEIVTPCNKKKVHDQEDDIQKLRKTTKIRSKTHISEKVEKATNSIEKPKNRKRLP